MPRAKKQQPNNSNLVKSDDKKLDVAQELDESGLTDKVIVGKIKEIVSTKPKRVFASDIIRLIELYAKIKGWIKEDSKEQTKIIQNFINTPIHQLRDEIDGIFKEIQDIENYDKETK